MNDIDIVDKVISAFIKELVKGSKDFLKELNDEGQAFINVGLKKYLSEKYSKYFYIRTILKGNTPVEFYSVYYDLGIIKRGNRLNTNRIGFISTKNTDGIFKSSNCITIIGEAGSGKSTLVKHLFIQSLKNKLQIPIMVELRYIEIGDSSFDKYIENIVIESEITTNERIIERMLDNGKFIFFFDGFDEINSENEADIVKGIDDFTSKYDKNKFILTTRPNSNGENISNFINYNIAQLSKKNGDINKFVDLQLKGEDELCQKIKTSLDGGVAKYIQSFLTNPLLLSLYILTYQSNAEIPDKKYIFYRRVINSLYSEHDSISKLGYVREKHSKLTQVELEDILKAFCFLSFFEGKFSFDYDYVVNKIDTIKKNNSDYQFDVNDFAYDMTVSVSLWTNDSGIFSFAHRSLQEYFCALFIKDLADTNKSSVYKKLLQHCEKSKNLTETRNFLSLCEEMDTVYFYKYYYLPLSNELYKRIDIGDLKNRLRNYVLFFCNGGRMISGVRNNKSHRTARPLVNDEVYKSIYIHIDHTKRLNDALSKIFRNSIEFFKFNKNISLSFDDNEGLLDHVVDSLMKNDGVKIITEFMQYLENEIENKNKYIDNTVKTDIELISMI